MKISELWVGDRFRAHGSLWTSLGRDGTGTITARKHSPESQALGARGYGYIGDTICSFEDGEEVEFLAVACDEPFDTEEPLPASDLADMRDAGVLAPSRYEEFRDQFIKDGEGRA